MKRQLIRHRFSCMGCPCEIRIIHSSTSEAWQAIRSAKKEANRLDSKFSHYARNNYLAEITRKAQSKAGVLVDEETAGIIEYCRVQHEVSNGLFDITIGGLTALWRQRATFPDQEELRQLLKNSGWRNISWARPRLKLPPGYSLDFGGVVKEYACDRAALKIRQSGITSALVNLGGDIFVVGPRPDGTAWPVGISAPETPQIPMGKISLTTGGLATSGDYQRFSVIEGQRYGHVVNPLSGIPVRGLVSASVAAPGCLIAGSISTLALLVCEQDGLDLLRNCGFPWLARMRCGQIKGTLSDQHLMTESVVGSPAAMDM